MMIFTKFRMRELLKSDTFEHRKMPKTDLNSFHIFLRVNYHLFSSSFFSHSFIRFAHFYVNFFSWCKRKNICRHRPKNSETKMKTPSSVRVLRSFANCSFSHGSERCVKMIGRNRVLRFFDYGLLFFLSSAGAVLECPSTLLSSLLFYAQREQSYCLSF